MKLNAKGFTLIELLVVVLIIGILASIALPQYQRAVYKSRLAALKSVVDAAAKSQEFYYLAHGEYANSLDLLEDIQLPAPSSVSDGKYVYSWGSCWVGLNSASRPSAVECQYTPSIIDYKYFMQHEVGNISAHMAGKRVCGVSGHNTNTPQALTCAADTGSTPTTGTTESGTKYTQYVYQ